MGKNSGFQNENNFVNKLNEKQIKDLPENLKLFILDIFQNATLTSLIKCEIAEKIKVYTKTGTRKINPKQDIVITINNSKKFISIKEGSNNSIHQEPIESFVKFLKEDGKATNEEIVATLKFHWGDGTLDGSGKFEDRLKGKELREKYATEIEIIQQLFNRNKLIILKRSLIEGAYPESKSQVDYFYHGSPEKGVWCSANFPLEVNLLPENELKPISVGLITFQNQNRNTTNNPSKEKARHDIQFKWNNMEAVLEKNMSTVNRLKLSMHKRVRGDNSHGFVNQDMIFKALNGSSLKTLKNNNLKAFIQSMFSKAENKATIICSKIDNRKEKGSFDITIGKDSKRILIKSGSNNSIHQESFDGFYDYLENRLAAPKEVINSFKLIQWGDGTLDGKTPKSKWMKVAELKKVYPKQIQIVRKYLNTPYVATKLLRRFLLEGTDNSSNRSVDFFYFGNVNDGKWASSEDIIQHEMKLLNEPTQKNKIGIGDTGLQNWGRTVKKETDMRTELQIKVSKLEEIITTISVKDKNYQMSKSQGNNAEIEFVRRVNQNDKSIMGSFRNIPGNIYAVNVTTKQYSSLTKTKVMPKSDVYLIRLKDNFDEQILFENSYILTEKIIEDIPFEKIFYSGISIKNSESKNFTYLKTSQNSFNALFNDSGKLFVPLLFYVNNENDFYKNTEILQKFNLTTEAIASYLNVDLSLGSEKQRYDQLKKVANKKMKEIIDTNKKIYETVFFGTNIFEEPYCATYFYQTNLIHKEDMDKINYSITTGSGRSKGKYTVIIKPR